MIITAGVTGHKMKMRDRPQRHRKSTEKEVQRRRKKLTGRTNWYKIKRQNQNRQKQNTREKGKKGDRKETGKGRVTTENKTPSSVLFMERTEEGKLATEVKEKEREINQIGRKKIKVVERNGAQLQSILTKDNPWEQPHCMRQDCLRCQHTEEGKARCREVNLVYQTICKLCKLEGEEVSYIGETSRSLYERTREHLRDYWDDK